MLAFHVLILNDQNFVRLGFNSRPVSSPQGWCIDQITLYNKVIEWNNKTNNLVCLNEKQAGFKRLDRICFDIIDANIKKLYMM